MNFIKILETLSDKELLYSKGSRRDSFSKLKTIGKDVALASIPFGLASISPKASAATATMASSAMQASPLEVLRFALNLEYLERDFYQMGLDSGVIASEDQDVFQLIADHESSHVDFLVAAVGSMGGDTSSPEFDFTAGGTLDTFTNYQTFMALAQGFEDTGVRAYKGQAGALANDNTLLTYALQIHSIEARHASQVRRMRGEKGWIVKNENTLPPNFSAIYAGEQNTVQGGVNLSGMFGNVGGDDAVTAAFDEPLTMDEVNAIAGLFIV